MRHHHDDMYPLVDQNPHGVWQYVHRRLCAGSSGTGEDDHRRARAALRSDCPLVQYIMKGHSLVARPASVRVAPMILPSWKDPFHLHSSWSPCSGGRCLPRPYSSTNTLVLGASVGV